MKFIRTFLLVAIIIFVVSACASTATKNTPVPQATAVSASNSTEVPTAAPTAAALRDAEMGTLITQKAHDMHTLDFILSHKYTAKSGPQPSIE